MTSLTSQECLRPLSDCSSSSPVLFSFNFLFSYVHFLDVNYAISVCNFFAIFAVLLEYVLLIVVRFVA